MGPYSRIPPATTIDLMFLLSFSDKIILDFFATLLLFFLSLSFYLILLFFFVLSETG